MGRPRNRRYGLVHYYPGSHSAICGSYGRSAVDSCRPGARAPGLAVSNDYCSWIPDLVVTESLNPGSCRDPEWRSHDRELWIQSGAISCTGSRRLQNPGSRRRPICKTSFGRAGGGVCSENRNRGLRQAVLRRGVGASLLLLKPGDSVRQRCVRTPEPPRWEAALKVNSRSSSRRKRRIV
jgi:hypothetical protein